LLILVFALIYNSPITISGKSQIRENGQITIKGESFEKEIKLNADGTFQKSITIEYDGIYAIETGKKQHVDIFIKERN
jgi:hypothetical protein